MPADKTARYKRQAEILRLFLANAGVDLKHTHALEAVAQMNGAKNWNTLQAAAHVQSEDALFLVSVLGIGLTTNYAVRGEAAARRMFCSVVFRVAALVDEPLEFFGQDADGGLPYLVAQSGGVTYVTLDQARYVEEQTIVDGKIICSEPIDLGPITSSKSYRLVAAALQLAFQTETESSRIARQKDAQRGRISHHLSVDWDEALRDPQTMSKDDHHNLASDADLAAVFACFKEIRSMVTAIATVQG